MHDYVNSKFSFWNILKKNSTLSINDLFQDLRDGVVLLRLLEALTGNEYVCHQIDNSQLTILMFLEKRKWKNAGPSYRKC